MLDTQTKRKIDSARDILVGKIPDPTSQVDQITTALIYKFMYDMDKASKQLGGKAKFFTGDFKKYSWSNIIDIKLSGQKRMSLYIQAISKLPKNENLPPLFREIFKNAFLPYRDAKTLNLFLKEINCFTYDHSETLGNAFEYLLSILSSQGDAGQFRTPRHIIDFMVEVVDPKKRESILDPACGTAGFLISAYKHIIKNNSKNYNLKKHGYNFAKGGLTPADKRQLQKNIIGYDISPKMVKLSLVNMFLHNFNKPKIYEYDTLTHDDRWGDEFDVILANPPFMTPKGGICPHKKFSILANRAEVLFVDYIIEHLTNNARAGVIVPEGIIFKNDKAYKALRKKLVEDHLLWAVVSLPKGVFQPYAGVKTSILFLDKQRVKRNKEVLFIDVQNDGFDLGAKRTQISKNDLPEAFKVLKAWGKNQKLKSKLAYLVNKNKISKDGDYNLTNSLYKVTKQRITKYPMVGLGTVCEVFIDGDWVESKDQSKTGIRLIQTGNIGIGKYLNKIDKARFITKQTFERLNCTEVLPGDILISRLPDPVGRACMVPLLSTKMITAVDCTIIRVNKTRLHAIFLLYLTTCKNWYSKIGIYLTGSSRQRISRKHLKQIKIPLPPLEVQKEIVAELEAYQKIIDGAKQIITNYKPTIKIDPSYPIVELGKIFSLEYGKALKKSKRKVGCYPVFGSNGIVGYHNKYLIKAPLIIVGRKGSAGKVNYYEQSGFPIDTTFYVKVKKVHLVNLKFLFFQLNKINLEKISSQSAVPGINRNHVYLIKIPLPPLDIQKKIVANIEQEKTYIESCKKLIKINEEKIHQKITSVWEQK